MLIHETTRHSKPAYGAFRTDYPPRSRERRAAPLPWFKTYVADFAHSAPIRQCSRETRAFWHDLRCIMHESRPYGHLARAGRPYPLTALAGMLGVQAKVAERVLDDLTRHGVFEVTEDGIIYCPRLVGDAAERERGRLNGALGGNPALVGTGSKSGNSQEIPRKESVFRLYDSSKNNDLGKMGDNPREREEEERKKEPPYPPQAGEGDGSNVVTLPIAAARPEPTPAATPEPEPQPIEQPWLFPDLPKTAAAAPPAPAAPPPVVPAPAAASKPPRPSRRRSSGHDGQTMPADYTPEFLAFWEAYPLRKGSRGSKWEAFRSFIRARALYAPSNPCDPAVGEFLRGKALMYGKKAAATGAYTQDAATWLNRRMWEVVEDGPATSTGSAPRPVPRDGFILPASAELAEYLAEQTAKRLAAAAAEAEADAKERAEHAAFMASLALPALHHVG